MSNQFKMMKKINRDKFYEKVISHLIKNAEYPMETVRWASCRFINSKKFSK